MNTKLNLKSNVLAGFLQEELMKKVDKESWGEDDYERPLVKIKKTKVKKNSVWWWNFSKNLVKELLP